MQNFHLLQPISIVSVAVAAITAGGDNKIAIWQ